MGRKGGDEIGREGEGKKGEEGWGGGWISLHTQTTKNIYIYKRTTGFTIITIMSPSSSWRHHRSSSQFFFFCGVDIFAIHYLLNQKNNNKQTVARAQTKTKSLFRVVASLFTCLQLSAWLSPLFSSHKHTKLLPFATVLAPLNNNNTSSSICSLFISTVHMEGTTI